MGTPANGFHWRLVQAAEALAIKHLPGVAEIPCPIAIKQQTPIGVAHGQVDVVQARDDRRALVGFFTESCFLRASFLIINPAKVGSTLGLFQSSQRTERRFRTSGLSPAMFVASLISCFKLCRDRIPVFWNSTSL